MDKVRAVWRRLTRVLSREGAALRVSGFLFKDVVQLVLIFVADTRVVTHHMGQVLGGFQDQVEQQLTRRLLWRHKYGKWEYTSATATREEAGFEVMEEYIWRRQNTVAQFIYTQSIPELCEETERSPGVWVGMRWWDKEGLDVAGAKETVAEADGDGMEK